MAILTPSQLQAASNATYFDNTSGSITPTSVRTLNDNWISSSVLATQTGSMTVGTASFAATASFALNFNPSATASYAVNAGTAATATSASYALQAGNATNASNADQATFANTAGAANSANTAVSANTATSASFASTASFALNFNPAATASYALFAATASFLSGSVTNATSASYAATSSKVSILDDNGNTNHKVLFANTAVATGGEQLLVDPTTGQFTYNPSTNLLVVTASLALAAQNANTASFVQNALSASYASNADLLDNLNFTAFVLTSSFTPFSSSVSSRLTAAPTLTGNNTFTGTNNFNVVSASFINAQSASIDYLSVIYQTSSVVYSSGSNVFGDAANDVQTLWGTVDIKTGPLKVSGSVSVSGAVFIDNNPIQITGPGVPTGTDYTAGTNNLLQLVGQSATALETYIPSSNDAIHVETAANQGTVFQDLNGQNFLYDTWLSIPSNASGTNPVPQFLRGLQVTGSLNALNGITGSLVGTATSASRAISAATASSVATLVQPVILSGSLRSNVVSASIASNTASLDFSQGNFFTSLVSGSTNFNVTNIRPGQTVNVLLTTVGVATASFATNIDQPSGSAYTPTSGSGRYDILTFISFDGNIAFLANVKNLI